MRLDYDDAAETYDNTRGVDERLVGIFGDRVPLRRGTPVLDFGCGTGNYLVCLRKQYGVDCSGVDPSAEMRRIAEAKDEELTIRAGDHAGIPFSEGTFRFAFAIDMVHHVPDVPAMCAELRRVLSPGALLCIVTESQDQIEARFYNRYFTSLVAVEISRYPDIDALIRNAKGAGLAHRGSEVLPQASARTIDSSFLRNVTEKNYSMFRMISDEEFEKGLSLLSEDEGRRFNPEGAGQTLLWFKAEEVLK